MTHQTSIFSSVLKGFAGALFLMVMAFSANAQQANVTNDLDCDIVIILRGMSSTCGTTTETVTVSPGTSIISATNPSTEWLVGAEVIKIGNCTVSHFVQDCSNIDCSCVLDAETSFTLPAGCCDNAAPLSIAFEVHQHGNDCDLRIYY